MKILMNIALYATLLVPAIAAAQGAPPIPDMGMNMQQAQKAMACMKTIDQSALKKVDQESRTIRADLQRLCRAGSRDEAQRKAMAYGKEMLARPEIQKLRECGKLAPGLARRMPYDSIEELGKDRHVCDDFGQPQ